MIKKIKNKIRRYGRNIVCEGILQYERMYKNTASNEESDKQNPQSMDYSYLAPIDLGYYSFDIGPSIDNKKLENCKVVSTRYSSLPLMPKGVICAEIGVAYGEFSECILTEMQPKELHLIDVYVTQPGDTEFFGRDWFLKSGLNHEQYIRDKFANEQKVIIKKGYSYDVLETYSDDFFDWVYVDGGHDYDCVKKDIEVLKRKVKNGGIIAFNDYTYFSLMESYCYGVSRAVNEFLAESDSEVIMYCIQPNKMDDLVVRLIK